MSHSLPLRAAAVVALGFLLAGWAASLAASRATEQAVTRLLEEEPGAVARDSGEEMAAEAGRRVARAVAWSVGAAAIGALLVVVPLAMRRAAAGERLDRWIEGLLQPKAGDPLAAPRGLPSDLAEVAKRIERIESQRRGRLDTLEAERHLSFQVLGKMVEGVLAINPLRRVVLQNRAAGSLLGISREAIVGRPLVELIRIPALLQAVDRVLEGQGPQALEFKALSAGERFVAAQAIPLRWEGGVGVLLTLHDRTQLRRLEELRREFVANVSHELKTPLAAIRGYVDTIEICAEEDPQAARHFQSQIGVQTRRLERLINDMLQLARAQAGPDKLAIAPVPLAPVIEESVAAYRPLAQERAITLTAVALPPGAAVRADRDALLTILNNLVGNAVRYTPEGGQVKIRCSRLAAGWSLVVEDTGVGIPESDQAKVFERFYRVDKAREASRGGTGLGLSIVKNLVQALSGEVSLRSRPGEGSTFEVRLPDAETDQA